MALSFSKRTFAYFNATKRHETSRAWFDQHKTEYEDNVLILFTHLVLQIKEALSNSVPGIEFSPKKISKPVRKQGADADGPVIRTNITVFFSEQATSMFEMNPGIYFWLGESSDDNVYGVGLYQPSSRQMKCLRPRLLSDVGSFEACLKTNGVRERWGGLSGESYKRFPKDLMRTSRELSISGTNGSS